MATTTMVRDLRGAIEGAEFKTKISEVLPRHIEPSRFIRTVLVAVSANPRLAECRPETVLIAAMQAAQLGLEVGSALGEAAIVPYKTEAKLLPMVRGLVTLAKRSGDVQGVSARLVFPGDHFEVHLGTRDEIIHRPDLSADAKREDKDATHAYAIFHHPGGLTTHDYMTRKEIEAVRAVSRAKDDGPWVDWWGEMAKKTVVKRGAKMMALSPEFRAAVELDNRFDLGRATAPTILDGEFEVVSQAQARTEARTDALREKVEKGKGKTTARVDPEGEAEMRRQREEDARG